MLAGLGALACIGVAACDASVLVEGDDAEDLGASRATVQIGPDGTALLTYEIGSDDIACEAVGDDWYGLRIADDDVELQLEFGRYAAPGDFFTFTRESEPAAHEAHDACRGACATAFLRDGATRFTSDEGLSCKLGAQVEGPLVAVRFDCYGIAGTTPRVTRARGEAICVLDER